MLLLLPKFHKYSFENRVTRYTCVIVFQTNQKEDPVQHVPIKLHFCSYWYFLILFTNAVLIQATHSS